MRESVRICGSPGGQPPGATRSQDEIPIAAQLRPCLAEVMLAGRIEYVFPGAEGKMRSRQTKLRAVLVRALKRAGLVLSPLAQGIIMDLELSGKIAVVTGASKGIGLAVTRALVGEGAKVWPAHAAFRVSTACRA